MKTEQLKNRSIYFLFLLFTLISFSINANNQEFTKKKEINKSFNANANDILQVDNRFGNITVTHWNKDEVAIRVVIESQARTEAKANAGIERVDVNIGKSGNIINAVTSFKTTKENWNNNENERISVHYYLQIPAKLTINLIQKYGNIILPDENPGKCSLNVKYGNLSGGNFSSNLSVEIKYGNLEIGNAKEGSFDIGYGGNIKIKNADKLNIDSKYSNLTLGKINTINLEKKYGNLDIEELGKGYIEIKYSEAKIGYLKEELIVEELDYSTLNIGELAQNFNGLKVNARYGNLNINISAKAAFTVEAEGLKYGSHSINGFNVTKSSIENKEYYNTEINNGNKRKIYFNGNRYSNIKINAL